LGRKKRVNKNPDGMVATRVKFSRYQEESQRRKKI